MTTPDPFGPSIPSAQTSAVPTADSLPRLCRSGTDRMLGGVSGGLADYTGIDAVLWRVAFVALTLLGGSGILFYALMWVLMPAAATTPDTPVERGVDRLRSALVQPLGTRNPRS